MMASPGPACAGDLTWGSLVKDYNRVVNNLATVRGNLVFVMQRLERAQTSVKGDHLDTHLVRLRTAMIKGFDIHPLMLDVTRELDFIIGRLVTLHQQTENGGLADTVVRVTP